MTTSAGNGFIKFLALIGLDSKRPKAYFYVAFLGYFVCFFHLQITWYRVKDISDMFIVFNTHLWIFCLICTIIT